MSSSTSAIAAVTTPTISPTARPAAAIFLNMMIPFPLAKPLCVLFLAATADWRGTLCDEFPDRGGKGRRDVKLEDPICTTISPMVHQNRDRMDARLDETIQAEAIVAEIDRQQAREQASGVGALDREDGARMAE